MRAGSILSRYRDSYISYIFLYTGYYLAFASYSSVLSVYLSGIGMTDREMSLILSAAGIFSFFIAPVTGYLNDRARNPKAVPAALLVSVGGLGLVFSACRGLWTLFLLNGVTMAFINSITPVCERVAGSGKYRYGVLRVWGTLGYAAGAQGAGLVLEWLPPGALFLLVAGACGLCLLGLWGVVIQPAMAGAPAQERGLPIKKKAGGRLLLGSLLGNPPFLLFLLAAFLFAGCSGVNINYSPVLLGSLGIPAVSVGTVLFLSTLTEIPLILFSHKFMDRLSGRLLTAICFLLAVGQYLAYGLASSPWTVVGVMVLVKAVASTLYMMLSLKMVRALAPKELTTTGLSVVASVNNLAGILLQNLGGWTAEAFGIQAMYLCMAGLCLTGLVLAAFLRVQNEQRVFS